MEHITIGRPTYSLTGRKNGCTHTHTMTDRQTYVQTYMQRDGYTDRHKDKSTHPHTDTQTNDKHGRWIYSHRD